MIKKYFATMMVIVMAFFSTTTTAYADKYEDFVEAGFDVLPREEYNPAMIFYRGNDEGIYLKPEYSAWNVANLYDITKDGTVNVLDLMKAYDLVMNDKLNLRAIVYLKRHILGINSEIYINDMKPEDLVADNMEIKDIKSIDSEQVSILFEDGNCKYYQVEAAYMKQVSYGSIISNTCYSRSYNTSDGKIYWIISLNNKWYISENPATRICLNSSKEVSEEDIVTLNTGEVVVERVEGGWIDIIKDYKMLVFKCNEIPLNEFIGKSSEIAVFADDKDSSYIYSITEEDGIYTAWCARQ